MYKCMYKTAEIKGDLFYIMTVKEYKAKVDTH